MKKKQNIAFRVIVLLMAAIFAIAFAAACPSDNLEATYIIKKVAMPTASLAADAVASGTTITLETTTPGATIHYTTNGSTPTATSAHYTIPITIYAETIIKAIAVKTGMMNSDMLETDYNTITTAPAGQVATPTASPAAGEFASGTTIILATATDGATIYYTTNGDTPTASSATYTTPITITATTTIKAFAVKTGMTDSDVMIAEYTIDHQKVATPTANPAAGAVVSGRTVALATATVGATIHYTTNGDTPTASSTTYTTTPIPITAATTIKAIAVKTDMTDSDVLTAAYTIAPAGQVATPTASPPAGAVVSGTTVALATATYGATIYYTTNGSTPTVNGSTPDAGTQQYPTTPIAITAATTIKAIAVKNGMTDSGVLTAAYTIAQVAKPTASPAAGEIASGSTITLATATTGATIHYTTDGSMPTASSASYSAPITVAATIRAIAVKTGMRDSDEMTASYTVDATKAAMPVATPAAGAVASGTTITLATATAGATIYYTINSRYTPTKDSTPYTAPIAITAATTIKAKAFKDPMTASETLTAEYTIDPFTTPVKYRELASISGGTVYGSGSEGVFISGRTVTVSAFKIAKYQTTYELWKEVYDWAVKHGYTFANPGAEGYPNAVTDAHSSTEKFAGKGTDSNQWTAAEKKTRPVTMVNWRDAIVWCNAYSEMSGKTPVYYTDATYNTVLRTSTNTDGFATDADKAVVKADANGYRLPTEAEWEYAARGGDTDAAAWGNSYAGTNEYGEYAWTSENSYDVGENDKNFGAHPVGTKKPNSAGLYDMSGNVEEWCRDWYNVNYIQTGTVDNPTGADGGAFRMVRGGACILNAVYCYVTQRYPYQPKYQLSFTGFRVVCR